MITEQDPDSAPHPTPGAPMAETRCRHCRAHIQLCNCGANNGQPHWSDGRTGPYCHGKATQLHEPVIPGKAAAFLDRDGRKWLRHESGRYFYLLTAPSGDQYWIDSSYGNLVAEFGPLTPTDAEVS